MANANLTTEHNLVEKIRRKRRSFIKKTGKKLIRQLGSFLGKQSKVGDMPVFQTENFDWAKSLEAKVDIIRQELLVVLETPANIPYFHEVSPDQAKISKGENWQTFVLFGFGYKSEANCLRCPETTRALEQIPHLRTAFFSILAPNYRIPPHKGVTKGVIRGHLALIVPKDTENCWIRIHDQQVSWEVDKCLVFDDTFDHEVHNDTDERRVVLLLDVDRPMRFWGRCIHHIFMAGIRWTAYVQDAKKNLKSQEEKLAAAVARADALNVDADDKTGQSN